MNSKRTRNEIADPLPNIGGLVPRRKDPRRFKHHLQFGSLNPAQLPPMGLGRKPLSIKNQSFTQFCTAYATATASEYIEGIEMSPEFQAAKIGEFIGHPILEGADGRAAMQTMRLFGSLPQSKAPLTLARDGMDRVAEWNNWPVELNQQADDYQKASFFDVMDGPLDTFDNIRVALFQAHQAGEQRVAVAFTQWFTSWNNPGKSILRRGIGQFSWHAHCFIDWTTLNGELVLVEQNSYGTAFGDGGLSYWSREAVNQLAEDKHNDIQMFRDISPETVKESQWTLAVIIFDQLLRLNPLNAIKWLTHFTTEVMTEQPTVPVTVPPAPEPAKRDLLNECCLAIQEYEGWFPPGSKFPAGSPSWRRNNPGNLRYGPFTKANGATGKSSNNFAIFPDYNTGFEALKTLVRNAASGKSPSYKPTMTLLQFFSVYAPSADDNDPNAYAKWFGKKLGVDETTFQIKQLLSA